MSSDPPPFSVRRAHPRHDVHLRVRLVRDDPFTGRVQTEETTTENLSAGGALVPTSLGVMKGEVIGLCAVDGGLDVRALVVGLRAAADGSPLLRLKFEGDGASAAATALLRAMGCAPGESFPSGGAPGLEER